MSDTHQHGQLLLAQAHVFPDGSEVIAAHKYAYTRPNMTGQRGLYVSELGWRVKRGYRQAMGDDISNKIRKLRISLGLNQTEFAERMNVTQASVSRWEKGSLPDADKLAQLADMAGETVKSFIGGSGDSPADAPFLNRYWVRGSVAAGVWTVAYEWPQEDWAPYWGPADVAAPEGTRFGLRVVGDSMNEIYPDGTVLDCISIDNVPEVRSGQRVIVERRRFDGNIEATAKEYFRGEDGVEWLLPRSSNPAFQAPISPSSPGEGIECVRIVAVVVGSYRRE